MYWGIPNKKGILYVFCHWAEIFSRLLASNLNMSVRKIIHFCGWDMWGWTRPDNLGDFSHIFRVLKNNPYKIALRGSICAKWDPVLGPLFGIFLQKRKLALV